MIRFNLIANQAYQDTNPKAMLLLVIVLGGLWVALVNHLRIEWTLNPQYGYGWAVPFLCAYLVWKKFHNAPVLNQTFTLRYPSYLLFFFTLLYAPTRLIEEADPEWRLVSWALAIELVGLTLVLTYFVLGEQWLKRLAFPIIYFLVAVPWPAFAEVPLIQGLTRADTGATVELLGWLGVPAIQHGNVIEVATGEVGIAEACSGIRSFQATLMISLFFGELYRLNFPRRLILILGGFTMSFLLNQVRMSFLIWVAARHGITTIAEWHDPAALTILAACYFALWGLGIYLARKNIIVHPHVTAASLADFPQPKRRLVPLLLSLLAWIFVVEISVQAWYRQHGLHLLTTPQWTIFLPTNNPTLKEMPLDKNALQLLKCDDSRDASWREKGLQWQAVFIKWNPGTPVEYGHTPDICMPDAGYSVITLSKCEWIDAGGFRLPFVVYEVMVEPRPYYIFYCMWNDVISTPGVVSMFPAVDGNRLALALAGVRNNFGHRSLEIALAGNLDEPEAKTALQQQLQEIIQTERE
ncbi:MAG: exosortase/archaeosortase family protein [Limisphaerales bacterium]